MGAADLLEDLQRRGVSVTITPEGDRLRIRGPHDETDLAALRHHKLELIGLLSRPSQSLASPSTAPLRDHDLLDLNEAEIEQMNRRTALARQAGYSDRASDQIADQLLRRDRQLLDLHCCLECRWRVSAHCRATDALQATRDWRPVLHLLQRCPAFLTVISRTD